MAQNPFDQFDGPAPSGGGAVIRDPKLPLEIDRMRQQMEIERERLRIAQQQAALDASNAARAAGKDARDGKTLEARGGVDSTESERTAAFLATRVAGGLSNLARIGDIGAPSLRDAAVGGTLLGNYATDEDRQRAINAQMDMLDAALTLGTGAAYTKEQLDGYRRSYFPQPGDKPETIADKSQRLRTLMEAARLKAGAASGLIDNAMSASGMFQANDVKPGLTEKDKDFLSKNARTLGEDGIRQFLALRGLQDEKGIADAVKYYGAGGGEDAKVNYIDTPVSQGLSGINEGIASTLGAPVDLANIALGAGAKGVNYLTGTDLAVSDRPMLGSEWWKDRLSDLGAIGPESDNAGMPFVRRVGQSIGAAAIPAGATARTGRQALGMFGSAFGGGAGAATAQQLAPGNQLAEMAGEFIGGGIPAAGAINSIRRAGQRAIEEAVPTIDDLKGQATRLYQQAENSGVQATPQQTADLHKSLSGLLKDEGRISPLGRMTEVMPNVKEGYNLVSDYVNQPMNPTQMQTVRRVLGDLPATASKDEQRLAGMMLDEFDQWADPLAPQLPQARSIANRYINAQKIKGARDLAEARASQFSQSGMENALRTEFRALDRNVVKGRERGMNQDVVDAVERVTRGTPTSNIARGIGKMAPNSTVSLGLGTVAPASLATLMGGPVAGLATGAATGGLGMFGRRIAENSALRSTDLAELVARNGGALPKPQVLTPELERLAAAGLFGQQSQYLGDR